jgi:hypothetical protein
VQSDAACSSKKMTPFSRFLLLIELAVSTAPAAPLVNMAVTLPHQEWVIGGPIVVTVTIENNSQRPFLFASAKPYNVATTDSTGRLVYNPSSEVMTLSGWFPETRIEASGSKDFQVDLANYADFETSGLYVVNLNVDPEGERGWPEYPAAKFQIQVRMPTPAEAEAMVRKSVPHHGGYRTFTRPVFLEPLKRAALRFPQSAVAQRRKPKRHAAGRIPDRPPCCPSRA